MKKSGRFTTTGLIENQYEEGSNGLVLKNTLGIQDKQVIEEIETRELYRVTDWLTEIYDQNHRFTASDICDMHKKWLGTVYEWAGKYRQVTMSKGNFTFALPRVIPQLMADFEKNELNLFTPCTFKDPAEQAKALAVAHTELLLIHPFREGNGRLSRLLATLMALQAGLPLLDFSEFEGQRKEEYFAAVRQGMARNYLPMEQVFTAVIARTLQAYEEN